MDTHTTKKLRRRSLLAAALLAAAAAVVVCGPCLGMNTGTSHSHSNLGTGLPTRLPASSGRGGTYWVDPVHGSDRSRGTRKRPWRSLNHALKAVPIRGSIINVLPGTYASNGTAYALTFARHGDVRDPITIQAARRGTVTIVNGDPSRATNGAWIIRATGLRIRGFRFHVLTRAGANVGANAVLIEDSSRIELERCIFNDASLTGLAVRGGEGRSANDIWAIANLFRPSGPNPTAQVTGLGFDKSTYYGSLGSDWIYAGQYGRENTWDQTSGTRRFVAVNNVFAGSAAGFDIQLGPQARNSFVVDNTFYGNRSKDVIGATTQAVYAGHAVELFSNTSNAAYTNGFNVVANNVFANLQGPAVAGSGPAEPGNMVSHNISWNMGDSGVRGLAPEYEGRLIFTAGAHNVVADPRLVDPKSYDFRLKAASPAHGVGDPSLTFPIDAVGRTRSSRPSLGAFELGCQGRAPC